MLPLVIDDALGIIPDRFKDIITLKRSAILFGILLPLAGNIIAEHQIFLGKNVIEHTGDIAMGALAIGLGVLSSVVIGRWLENLSVKIGGCKR